MKMSRYEVTKTVVVIASSPEDAVLRSGLHREPGNPSEAISWSLSVALPESSEPFGATTAVEGP